MLLNLNLHLDGSAAHLHMAVNVPQDGRPAEQFARV